MSAHHAVRRISELRGKVKYELWTESDIFSNNKDDEHIIEDNICEINQDDDVDTDDEVLCSGI